MKRVSLCVTFATLAVIAILCGCGKPKAKQPVVGVAECMVYADYEFKTDSQSLTAGTEVKVLNMAGEGVQIQYPSGSGWVHRYALCSREEYERRKQAEEIPEQVVTIVYNNGSFYLTGGAISIGNNQPIASPGQGFWMDSSTEGHPDSIASTVCLRGDHLHFITKANKVVQLPIWK